MFLWTITRARRNDRKGNEQNETKLPKLSHGNTGRLENSYYFPVEKIKNFPHFVRVF